MFSIKTLGLLFGSKNVLYLPIEIHSREIHSRLYLARTAALNGWCVVIGPRYELSELMQFLPRGSYLGIGFHSSAARIAQKLKNVGHKVFSLDEEGMVRLPPRYYREFRVSKAIFDVSEKVICWSQGHFDEIKEFEADNTKVVTIGSPRLDILAPEARTMFARDAGKIRKEYGKFILINSSFGTANNLNGLEHWRGELKKRGWFDTVDKSRYQEARICFQTRVFHLMRDLAAALAERSLKLVIRPHPSENLSSWKKLEADYPNIISVVREGNVIPWILASEVMIHNGCTTAIEGRLLDKPIISYRPIVDSMVESELANSAGLEFFDQDQLVDFLNEKLNGLAACWPVPPKLSRREVQRSANDDNFSMKFIELINGSTCAGGGVNWSCKYKAATLLVWKRLRLFLSGYKNKTARAYEKQKCHQVTRQEALDIMNHLMTVSDSNSSFDISSLTNRSIVISSEQLKRK